MVRFTGGLLLFSAFSLAARRDRVSHLPPTQHVLVPQGKSEPGSPRKLQGKFLHITDIHPDPFYKVGSSGDVEHACHSGSGAAGPYGAEITDCDAPFSLVNATFQWINDNLKDEVDFVIWTGDSARHDNDEEYPRSETQVVDLNVYIVNKFVEVFGKDGHIDDPDPTNDFVVPIVPTFGNNDILPHNIFTPGPNKWTHTYASVWNHFVPEEQRHSFERGGWFFIEVIPNRLAVFSVNTLYFFDSNSAVDGCDAKSEPGYEHMEWLRIQLQFLRDRGMKAIMTGHVPPARTESKASWDETCWQKWTLWMRLYRDVVVGNVFGHMNIDHFLFQDMKELKFDFAIKGLDELTDDGDEKNEKTSKSWRRNPPRNNDNFTVEAKNTYLNELREGWSTLPAPPRGTSYSTTDEGEAEVHPSKKKKKSKKQREKEKFLKDIGGKWAERYTLNIVSPSVVPNFFPSLRIVEYNITGLEGESPATRQIGREATMPEEPALAEIGIEARGDSSRGVDATDEATGEDEEVEEQEVHELKDKKKKKKKKKKKTKKPGFKVPKAPSKSSPPGPAYSMQTFTFLGYTQYYANLTTINRRAEQLIRKGKKKDQAFKYEIEYNTRNDTATGGGFGHGYGMRDLTVREWLGLAERIGRKTLVKSAEDLASDEARGRGTVWDRLGLGFHAGKTEETKGLKNDLWRTFVKRAFVSAKPDEELDDEFS